DARPADQVLGLLGVRVPVQVVARARREHRETDHMIGRADGFLRDDPPHGHVVPAGGLVVDAVDRDRLQGELVRVLFGCHQVLLSAPPVPADRLRPPHGCWRSASVAGPTQYGPRPTAASNASGTVHPWSTTSTNAASTTSGTRRSSP